MSFFHECPGCGTKRSQGRAIAACFCFLRRCRVRQFRRPARPASRTRPALLVPIGREQPDDHPSGTTRGNRNLVPVPPNRHSRRIHDYPNEGALGRKHSRSCTRLSVQIVSAARPDVARSRGRTLRFGCALQVTHWSQQVQPTPPTSLAPMIWALSSRSAGPVSDQRATMLRHLQEPGSYTWCVFTRCSCRKYSTNAATLGYYGAGPIFAKEPW